MKRQKACAFFVFLFASCLHASAQNDKPPLNEPDYNKPHFFADVPDKLPLRLREAESLLTLAVGTPVNAVLGTAFTLSGTVMSKSNPADLSVQSIVIKSAVRGGAIFTFTRIKNNDGSFLYRGRMIAGAAGDALEIVKEGDNYLLRKRGYYDMINE